MGITSTIHGFKFGSGGPYRLAPRAPYALTSLAKAHIENVATLRVVEAHRERTIAKGLDSMLVDSTFDVLREKTAFTESHVTAAFYKTGYRWCVLVIDGHFIYLSESMDDDGKRLEPAVMVGRMDGVQTCLGCKGARIEPRFGGMQSTCGLCRGSGEMTRDLPPPVVEAVERQTAESLASIARRPISETFEPAEDERDDHADA